MKQVIHFVFLLFCSTFLDAKEATQSSLQLVDSYLLKAAENDYSGSFLIAQNGKILLQKGYGLADREKAVPFSADTVFDIGSLTKQFTAAAILKLEMQKKLSVQELMSKYLKGVPADKKDITIHHLLTHSAGLADALGSDEEYVNREDYLKLAFASKLVNPIGAYAYSNVGYSLLAVIIEIVSGKEYEQFVRESLLLPAGIKQTGYALPAWDRSKMAIGYRNQKRWGTTYDQSDYSKGVTWHLRGNGGIHSTVEDMFLWYVALQGDSILNEEEKRKYFHPHVPENPEGDSHYAYGWAVFKNKRGEHVITHNGGNGYFMATLAMIPAQNVLIVVSSNHAPKDTDTIATRVDRIVFEGLKPLDEEFIRTYSGKYVLPSGAAFTISFNENDEAVALLAQNETFLLLSGSESEDREKSAIFDKKTEALLKRIRSGDLNGAASMKALQSSPEESKKQFQEWRAGVELTYGPWRGVEVLGSVSRRLGTFFVTAVKLLCEKGDVYQLIVWNGNQIIDIRDLPRGNTKPFEHVSGNEFYSEGNDLTILFEKENDIPVLTIKGKGKAQKAQ